MLKVQLHHSARHLAGPGGLRAAMHLLPARRPDRGRGGRDAGDAFGPGEPRRAGRHVPQHGRFLAERFLLCRSHIIFREFK